MRKAGSVEKIFLRAAELLASGKKYCCCHAIDGASKGWRSGEKAKMLMLKYYYPEGGGVVEGDGFTMADLPSTERQDETFWMTTVDEYMKDGHMGNEETRSRRVLAMVNMAQIARMEGV